MSMDLPTEPAKIWLRASLEQGSTLWKLVAQRMDFGRGRFMSTLPGQVGTPAAENFQDEPADIRTLVPASNTRERVNWVIAPAVTLIKNHLANAPNNLAIIGHEDRKKGGPLAETPGLYRFFDSEVYNFLLSDSTELTIGVAIQSGYTPWRSPGLLTSVSNKGDELRKEDLALDDLQAFVDRTTMLIAAAYDFWGFVVWTRADASRSS